MPRRVDDLRPHEQAADDEAQVHEVVPEAMVERGLVEARDVPGDENDDPHCVAHAGAEQEPEEPAQPAVEEEPDRDQSDTDHEGLERPGPPEIFGREHGTHGVRLAP